MDFAKLYDQINAMSDQQQEDAYQEILYALNLSDEIKEAIDAQFRQHSLKTRLSGLIFFAGMPVIPRYIHKKEIL